MADAAPDTSAAATIAAADQLAAATKAAPDPAPAAPAAAAEKPAAEAAAPAAAAADPGRKDAAPQAEPPRTYALTLPPDSPLDLATVTAEATALGLTNDQAQKLATARHDAVAAAVATINRDYAEVRTDPALGGAHFDTTMQNVHRAMTYLFDDDLAAAQDLFTRFGLANNKVLVKALNKLGHNRKEDSPIAPGQKDTTAKRRPEEVLYGTSA